MIERAIYQLLLADSAISAIVSNRIYPDVADEGVQGPYLVYQKIGGFRPLDIALDAGQKSALIQIDAYGVDAEVVRGLGELLIELFHGTPAVADGNEIQFGLLQGEPVPGYEEVTELRRLMVEFIFYYH